MRYRRPKIDARLDKEDKVRLMRDFVEYYQRRFASTPSSLNRKIPREAFAELIDDIGALLLRKSALLANRPCTVFEFLRDNPLPPSMGDLLPKEVRAFCLGLNALKQWVAAEQQATDRLILGGSAREICRAATSRCLVTGTALNRGTMVLHHPVRDGRPPLPVSKEGHNKIEGQEAAAGADSVDTILLKLKHEGKRSWVQLRRGCLELLGRDVKHSTESVRAASRTFARRAKSVTGLGYEQILEWLDRRDHAIDNP